MDYIITPGDDGAAAATIKNQVKSDVLKFIIGCKDLSMEAVCGFTPHPVMEKLINWIGIIDRAVRAGRKLSRYQYKFDLPTFEIILDDIRSDKLCIVPLRPKDLPNEYASGTDQVVVFQESGYCMYEFNDWLII